MTLTAPRFDVLLDQGGDLVSHTVTVHTGDQLRAELEQNKLRLPGLKDAPLHATALWVWAACARLGVTQATAQPFITSELVAYQPAEDEAVVPVDPTGLPSSSESP